MLSALARAPSPVPAEALISGRRRTERQEDKDERAGGRAGPLLFHCRWAGAGGPRESRALHVDPSPLAALPPPAHATDTC